MPTRRQPAREHNGARSRVVHSWLRPETLESLAELNEQCLELLCDQARAEHAPAAQPLLTELSDLWKTFDAAARRRAATCPYLIVDAGFADARRWSWARGQEVHDGPGALAPAFFTVPRAPHVTRLVFTYAWHLARSPGPAARLLLGMSARCAELIAGCSLRHIAELAERYPEWLQPRWPSRVMVWRELLIASIAEDEEALERARLRGVQLLAAELRARQSG
ncbi:MAG: hypothetical protein DIU56_008715 [Pseudomonadota bacterium]|jgi:hypothetical protein